VILEKSCSKTSQQKDHDMAAKRNNTWQQKCRHVAAKMSPSQDALHIYLKN